ncbi:MAG: adenylosuccinate synthase, partial [Francisellaceae bacterium]|nr:adenylosuccinate synthase [Francisellaceae bacterium]
NLKEKLIIIQKYWVYKRLCTLGIEKISNEWQDRLSSIAILETFIIQATHFYKYCRIRDNTIIQEFPEIIFEGAQGLLLDEEKGFFPHVTRSSTGLKNVLSIIKEFNIKKLEVFYISRAYLTRHGRGPLPFELNRPPYKQIIDNTNVNNPYQESLRFAWLNIDLLQQAIDLDLKDAPPYLIVKKNLVFTCIDYLDENLKFIKQNKVFTVSKNNLFENLTVFFPDFTIWQSKGATRTTLGEVGLEKHLTTSF